VSTDIMFDGDPVRVEQVTVGATAGWFPTWRRGLSASIGALVAGRVEGRALGPGLQVAFGGATLVRRERKRRPWPFVLLTGSLAGVIARGEADDGAHRYAALDARIGVAVGKSFVKGKYSAYLAVRGFGGPVFWRRLGEETSGGDRYHVTAGAGATYRIPGVLDIGVEAMPLGERSATASVTFHR
jgi:hypothetical protein